MATATAPTDKVRVDVQLPVPHLHQAAILGCNKKRIMLKAGRRSGKTVGVSMLAVNAFLEGKRVLYGAPTVEQTNKFWYEVTKALKSVLDVSPQYHKNENEHFIERVGTENRIIAKTAWNPDGFRGDYADLFIMDEWQLMNERTWDEVGAPMMLDRDGTAVFIYTPRRLGDESGMSHATDPMHATKMWRKVVNDPEWGVFHFTSFDNPHLKKEALDRIAQDMSRSAFRREILAEDDDTADSLLVYSAFNGLTQILEPYPIPAGWPVYTGHDFGSANPAALFVAQDPATGFFYVFHEYLPGAGRSTAQHVEEFKKVTMGHNVVRRKGGSHQEDEIRQGYMAHGWPITEPLINGHPGTVGGGIDKVRGLMELNRIFVFRTCPQTISQLANYLFKMDASGAITDEIHDKAKFHLLDCLRYLFSDFTPVTVSGPHVVFTHQRPEGGIWSHGRVESPIRVVSTSHA